MTALANGLVVLSLLALVALNTPVFLLFEEVSRYAHLHLALEGFALALLALLIGLSLRQLSANNCGHAQLLGAGFAAVAIVDAAHTLSYKGMPDFFGPSDPEKAINLWLIARALGAATLLAAALMKPTSLRPGQGALTLLAGVGLGLGLSLAALVYQDQFPRTFIAGQGLTDFKVATEIFIALACVVASVLLYRQHTKAAQAAAIDFRMLAAAAWVFALTGSFFSSYQEVTDTQNMLGHIYKIIGCGFLVKAVWRKSGSQTP